VRLGVFFAENPQNQPGAIVSKSSYALKLKDAGEFSLNPLQLRPEPAEHQSSDDFCVVL